jgi:hypothetical protein
LAALTSELNTLQKAEISSLLEVIMIERFQPFLLLVLALMVAIEFIPDRVARKLAKERAAMRGELSVAGGQ